MALPWTLHGDGKDVGAHEIVLPGERLTWPRTIGLGAQHVVAMFGATFLVPLLTGFPPATTLLFSGVGTILFLLITRQPAAELPRLVVRLHRPDRRGHQGARDAVARCSASWSPASCWRSSASSCIGTGTRLDRRADAAGRRRRDRRADRLQPGARREARTSPRHPCTALVTLAAVILCTVLFRGMLGRLSIFLGVVVGYVVRRRSSARSTSAAVDEGRLDRPARSSRCPANPFTDAGGHLGHPAGVPPGRARADRRERRATSAASPSSPTRR